MHVRDGKNQEPSELFVAVGFLLSRFDAWLFLCQAARPEPTAAALHREPRRAPY